MRRIYFVGAVLLFCCAACNQKEHLSNSSVEVSENFFTLGVDLEKVGTDTVLTDLELIPLVDTPQALFGNATKVLEAKGRYYVLDEESTKAVYVFDSAGLLIKRVREVGDGPGQYKEPRDLVVDTTDGSFWLDVWPMKIMHFGPAGAFITEQPRPVFSEGFARLTNGWAFSSHLNRHPKVNLPYNLFVTDHLLAVQDYYFSFNPNQLGISVGIKKYFSTSPDGLYYCYPYSDSVYHISPMGKPSLAFTIDFGKKWMTPELKKAPLDARKMADLKAEGNVYYIDNLCITNHHIIFSTVYQSEPYIIVYHKRTRKQFVLNIDDNVTSMIIAIAFASNRFEVANDGDWLIGSLENDYLQGIISSVEDRSELGTDPFAAVWRQWVDKHRNTKGNTLIKLKLKP
jgi:6-bladed beta-propeller